ncbi:MAG: DUF4386 domain-containing protein [Candidatus Thorarchaeota archaeon]|jgi:hypothetical protein
MSNRFSEIWQRDPARVAGLMYLFLTIFVFIGAIRFIIAPGVAVTPADIFIARIGFTSDLISIVFFLLLAWALYVLFSPVNKNLALLVLLSISVSVAIQCINSLNYFAALSLLSGADYMTVFQADQVQALAMFYLDLYAIGGHIAEIFWFLWLLPAGYLIFKSGILPRNLGILLMLGSFSYLMIFLEFFLFPSYGVMIILGGTVAGLAEISLMVWLLVKGVKMPENQNNMD